jgi:hypothetical protein
MIIGLTPELSALNIKNNKYSYLSNLNFPFISELKRAYQIIESNFIENLDYYLTPESNKEFADTIDIISRSKSHYN